MKTGYSVISLNTLGLKIIGSYAKMEIPKEGSHFLLGYHG